jgi:replicative DNA helicase
MSARPLPHSLDMERAVLGAILLRPDVLYDVADRRPDDFFRDAHRRIFRHMLRLAEQKIQLDFGVLQDALARTHELETVGGPAYITALVDGMPRGSNAAEHARIVCEKALLRQVIAAVQQISAEAFEEASNASEILDAAQARLHQIAARQVTGDIVDMPTLMAEVVATIEARRAHRGLVSGVPTGFTELDEITRGLQPEDLIVLAARPSVGKTSFAMNVIEYACIHAGRRAAAFSLEMGRQSLGLRLLASQARVNHHDLQTGYIRDEAWSRIANAMEHIGSSGIHIIDASSPTVFDIRARARRLQAAGGLDLIVIDYLQLMRGAQRAENKNLEVAEISRSLKAIARDLKVPILLLSQLSREPERRTNHRPQLSDLRDSGAIEQDSDVVLFLHREERYDATDENRGVAEVIVSKHRNGPTALIKLAFHESFVRFDNLATPGMFDVVQAERFAR